MSMAAMQKAAFQGMIVLPSFKLSTRPAIYLLSSSRLQPLTANQLQDLWITLDAEHCQLE